VDEVSTTRSTPARRAAPIARSVPSTAGRISSPLSLGIVVTKGEAECIRNRAPAIASSQPASLFRFSVTNSSREMSSPASHSALRTSSARAGLRKDPRT
jgi:hypothetical protein